MDSSAYELVTSGQFLLPTILIAIWTLYWKGRALYRAGKNQEKAWFVVLLLVNTLGLLDILYLYVFSKRGKK
jgi:hypothetical protein